MGEDLQIADRGRMGSMRLTRLSFPATTPLLANESPVSRSLRSLITGRRRLTSTCRGLKPRVAIGPAWRLG